MSEIIFDKYKTRGHGYHWGQIDKNPFKRNLYVLSRYKLIIDLLGDKIDNRSIADVGCGDGVLSYLLAKKGARVTGIDNSAEAISYAKKKLKNFINLNFLICRIPRMLASGCAGVVVYLSA